MIKKILLLLFFVTSITTSFAQESIVADTNLVRSLLTRGQALFTDPSKFDSCEIIFNKALALSEKHNYTRGIQEANDGLANYFYFKGKLSRTLSYLIKNEESAIATGDSSLLFSVLRLQAAIYGRIGDINMYRQSLMRRQYIIDNNGIKGLKDTSYHVLSQYNSLAQYYASKRVNNQDSVQYFYRKMNKLGVGTKSENLFIQLSNGGLGGYYIQKKMYDSAIYHLRIAAAEARKGKRKDNYFGFTINLADVYQQLDQLDSSFKYAYEVYNGAVQYSYLSLQSLSSGQLAKNYRTTKQYDSAVKYMLLERDYKDSLAGAETLNSIQFLTNDYQQKGLEKQREKEQAIEEYKATLKNYFYAAGILLLLIVIAVLYRINKQRAKSRGQIESAYNDLKATQAQLIQSEKMASLGELTAGIAHEIQNPLNFVNNFSDVNKELIDELLVEIKKGNTEEVKALANDIKDNEGKINHHGKRADSIVKGMLQHSRSSTGQKEPTDINVLADEYLRLSYHGLRAKNKSFNADLKTDYDASIGKINIMSQDVGRVLMNLLTNAFYSVSEKQKQGDSNYKPTVSLQTLLRGKEVIITVSDNGNGVPQQVADKIFQPFFTTKPTGHGTGLGLSLSYDIIKAHAGTLTLETEEGKYAKFTITLPA